MTHKCVPIADCMSWLIDLKTCKEDPSLNLQIADVTRANINWEPNQNRLFGQPNNDRISSHNAIRMKQARNCLRTSSLTFHTDISCISWMELFSCRTESSFQRVSGKLSCRKHMMHTWES